MRTGIEGGKVAKYDPLGDYLAKQRGGACTLTHTHIEEILGAELLPTARRRRQWWGNEVAGTHVQCRSWLDSGWAFDEECQPERGVVRFVRAK